MVAPLKASLYFVDPEGIQYYLTTKQKREER
jgi:hypothetical protein